MRKKKEVTILNPIVQQLWKTKEHKNILLAAMLVSDKEVLRAWWASANGAKKFAILQYSHRVDWAQLHDLVHQKKPRYNIALAEEVIDKYYLQWQNLQK